MAGNTAFQVDAFQSNAFQDFGTTIVEYTIASPFTIDGYNSAITWDVGFVVSSATILSVIGPFTSGGWGIWGNIYTDQTPAWGNINDTQTPSWANVPTEQTAGWVLINNVQTPSWVTVPTVQTPTWTQIQTPPS